MSVDTGFSSSLKPVKLHSDNLLILPDTISVYKNELNHFVSQAKSDMQNDEAMEKRAIQIQARSAHKQKTNHDKIDELLEERKQVEGEMKKLYSEIAMMKMELERQKHLAEIVCEGCNKG